MNKIYKKYTNLEIPGSFSGLSGFLKNNKNLNRSLTEETLKKTLIYTSHKPKRINYRRIKVQVGGIDSQWQIDLIEMQGIAGSNFGSRYIFVCIDVFSKKSWGSILKNKQANSCLFAFRKIIENSKRKPKYIYIDNGLHKFT